MHESHGAAAAQGVWTLTPGERSRGGSWRLCRRGMKSAGVVVLPSSPLLRVLSLRLLSKTARTAFIGVIMGEVAVFLVVVVGV